MLELNVQKYLREGNTLDQLEQEFSINYKLNDDKKLVVLNYSQTDSSKTCALSSECRGLILECNSWNIVSKAFYRFFNMGETSGDGKNNIDLNEGFDFTNCDFYEKRDGSLVQIFQYNNEWIIATRGAIDNNNYPINSSKTFNELIIQGLKNTINNFTGDVFVNLDKNFTYIFEICSPENRIVTNYDKTELTLLGARDIYNCEVGGRALYILSENINIKLPKKFNFNNTKDVIKELNEKYPVDFEGVVCVGRGANKYGDFQRVKLKKESYINLHRIVNKLNVDYNILNLIIKNEQDNAISKFPHYKENIKNIENKWNTHIKKIEDFENKFIDYDLNNKDFAISIKDVDTIYKPYLFAKYNKKCTNYIDYVLASIKKLGYKNICKKIIKKI